MAKRFNTNQLNPGDVAWMRGKVVYSHIASHIEGEELQKSIERARQRGQRYYPTTPYTTISIHDAEIMPATPGALTLLEEYLQERMFQSKSPENSGWNYRFDYPARNLPKLGQMQPDGKTVSEIIPAGELARELDVTLVFTVYRPKSNANNGIALTQIIVNEPVRYYSNDGIKSMLEQRGLMYIPLPADAQRAAEQVAPEMDEDPAVTGYAQEANMMPPVAPPAGNPYQTMPPAPAGIRWDPKNRRY